jgi:formate dehydrogenase major subunit
MADTTHSDLRRYLDTVAADRQKGFWRNADTYFISLLKEYWGDAATADNDYCFDYLPRINGDHGTYRTVMDMVDGKVFGYFLLGQNPAVGSAHGRLQRLGLAKLDWLVVRDLAMIESATFWQDAPEIETGEIVPGQCATEVFFLPAAAHTEKSGTFTQTQRMLQWRDQAVDPAGDQRSDLWFAYHLGRRLKQKLAGSADHRDRPLLDLAWDYRTDGDEPSAADVLRRISGVDLGTGRAVSGYLAAEPAGAVQPGLRRPAGPALERAQGPGLVGRRAAEVDRPRHPRLRGGQAPGLPAARGRGGPGRAGRRRRVHHDVGREGLAVRSGRPGRRAAAHAL